MRTPPSRRRFLRLSLFATAAACAPDAKPIEDEDEEEEEEEDEDDTGSPAHPAESVEPITSNADFYQVTYSGSITVEEATWSLSLEGACTGARTISYADLTALPTRDKEHTLCCISSSERYHAVGNAVWSGLPLTEVLDAFGVAPTDTAIELHFASADGYRTAIPVTDLVDRAVWLVWRMNGEILPIDHGFPVRVLVPNRYGMKNPKWLTAIGFGTEALVGTWESFGWSNDCTYRPFAFLHLPPDNSTLADGAITLAGSAYCGSVAIDAVQVSTDDGDTWQEVEWTYRGPVDAWSLWRLRWTPPGPGTYTLLARATAADGRVSDPDFVFDRAGFQGYGALVLEIV